MVEGDLRYGALRLLVERLKLHSELSSADCADILALPGEVRSLKARSDFVHVREGLDHSCLVASGMVGRYTPLENGARQIVSVHIPGDLVDIYSLMLPHAPIPLVALSAAEIIRIPHAALRKLLAASPSLAMVLLRDTVVDAVSMAQTTVNVGRRDVRDRLAHLVCELAVRFDRIGLLKGLSLPFPITQEQLGDLLALTSVHIYRRLKSLREDGLLRVAGGRIDILDWERLQTVAGFNPDYLYPTAESWPSLHRRRR